jgi:nucleotide-binding universal stress UspA family protein
VLLDFTIDISLFALSSAGYISFFVPVLKQTTDLVLGGLTFAGTQPWLILLATTLVVGLTALNVLGVRESSRFNEVLGALDVISESAIIVLGFVLAFNPDLLIYQMLHEQPDAYHLAYGASLAIISFVGLESISQASQETIRPATVVPRTSVALIITVLIYALAFSTLGLGMLPWQSFAITPIGIILGLLVLGSIGGTLWWMVRLPQPSPTTVRVARAVRHARHITHILVPAHGGVLSERVVAFAAELARPRDAGLELLYVQEIPRLLPPDAVIPAEEQRAQEVCHRSVRIAQSFEVHPTCRIVRARDAGAAIVHEAIETGTDLIMMGAGPPPSGAQPALGPASQYVFRYAPCEVLLDRAPRWEETTPLVGEARRAVRCSHDRQ